MAKKQAFVTPPMTVRYAILVTPSTTYKADGEFRIKAAVKAESPEAEELKSMLQELMDKHIDKATADLKPAQKGKLFVSSPLAVEENSETGEETGYLTIGFALPHKVKRKSDGEEFTFYPNIYDSKNTFIPVDERGSLNIGAGSVVRISFTCENGYCMEVVGEKGKLYRAGLKTDLKGVKILKMVAGGASAEGDGFGADQGEYGYTKREMAAPDSDFDKPQEKHSTDGDF